MTRSTILYHCNFPVLSRIDVAGYNDRRRFVCRDETIIVLYLSKFYTASRVSSWTFSSGISESNAVGPTSLVYEYPDDVFIMSSVLRPLSISRTSYIIYMLVDGLLLKNELYI